MKPRPASFVDNKLKQRVIQYLTSNRCGKYVDTGVLASDLQRMYSIDYGRRKRNAFRIQKSSSVTDYVEIFLTYVPSIVLTGTDLVRAVITFHKISLVNLFQFLTH
uniref:Nuclear VCP like n=1 Tax=Rousettus aegyptiacus TaxID=9407 RepID=A0A7J8B9Z1_ROUAE|nr:nuclear VCP like [Rousettus aegyptiacus]